MSDDDLAATYRDYEASGAPQGRWSARNRGNRAIHDERNAAFASVLHDRQPRRLLEVGCGEAALLEELAAMAPDAHCVGVDVLAFRLVSAVARKVTALAADGRFLPFPAGAFDAVVLSTVLSSVLDDTAAVLVAADVARVLRPGGVVLWYDMRLPNLANAAVQPVGRARLRALFPGLDARFRSLTVLPPIARRLGPLTPIVYPVLAALPPLRSHLFAVLEKPADPGASRSR